jgi:predicted ArsR family transcriptional regulator
LFFESSQTQIAFIYMRYPILYASEYYIRRARAWFSLKPLTVTERKILVALGEGGESTMYEISKRGPHYPNVHTAMKELKERGFVYEVRREPGQKGNPKQVYDLTRDGEILLVATVRSLDFDRFAKRNGGWLKTIPPLSRWSVLKERKATAVAKLLLQEASRRVLNMTEEERKQVSSIERVFEEIETTIQKQATPEEHERWEEALCIDDELSHEYEGNMKEDLAKHIAAARSIRRRLKRLQLLRRLIEKARKNGVDGAQLDRMVSQHFHRF